MMHKGFLQRRAGILAGLAANLGDKSRKGSVDVRALGVIQALNAWPDAYTTSSCSGRISVFAEPTEETRLAGKKGGEWVYASHDPADETEVLNRLHDRCVSGAQLVFRFEPFLLHAECAGMAAANRLLAAARLAGFRESGATQASGEHGRIIVGIRCNLKLEVPVADAGQLLVSDDYIRYLVRLANDKFDINTGRIKKLQDLIAQHQHPAPPNLSTPAAPPASAKARDTSTGATIRRPAPDRSSKGTTASANPTATAAAATVPAAVSTAALGQQGALGAPARVRKLRGVDPALHTPLQDLRARQVALLRRLADLAAQVAGDQQRPASGGSNGQPAAGSIPAGAPAKPTIATGTAGSGRAAKVATAAQGVPLVQSQRGTPARARGAAPVTASDEPRGGGQLAWRALPLAAGDQDWDPASLLRWGGASVMWQGRMVVVAGYGGAGTHSRRADVLLCDPPSGPGDRQQCYRWTCLQPAPGSPVPTPRMGHALAIIDDYLVMVGGRSSPAQPLSDVWLFHMPTHTWCQVGISRVLPAAGTISSSTAAWPGRYRHSAVAVTSSGVQAKNHLPASCVYVFGGRTETTVLSDLWVLVPPVDLSTHQPTGATPSQGWQWVQVPQPSVSDTTTWPSARKSHAAVALDGDAYVHGGTALYGGHEQDMYRLNVTAVRQYVQSVLAASDTETQPNTAQPPVPVWQDLQSPATRAAADTDSVARSVQPPVAMSHTLCVLGQHHLVLAGGHPTALHEALHIFDTRTATWTRHPVQQPDLTTANCIPGAAWMPVRHCAALFSVPASTDQKPATHRQQLVLVGGGAFCFSFGSVFSGAFVVDITDLAASLGIDIISVTPHIPASTPATVSLSGNRGTPKALSAQQQPTPPKWGLAVTASPQAQAGQGDSGWVLQLPAASAKAVKDALKAVGWLDTKRKGGELQAQSAPAPTGDLGNAVSPAGVAKKMVVLPLTAAAVQPLLAAAAQPQSQSVNSTHEPGNSPDTNVPAVVLSAVQAGAQLLQLTTAVNRKDPQSQCPTTRMQQAVSALLRPDRPPAVLEQLMKDLPTKWERLEDLALVPNDSLINTEWPRWLQQSPSPQDDDPMASLYQAVCAAVGGRRLARQAPVANTGTRDSQAVLLLGTDGWVHHREHGVTYVLDVTRCMYSSGNITERGRMGGVAAAGETVVDLFTGIGYYTLPMLVRAGAAKVYACEWNPNALKCLERGLVANGVRDKCEIRPGDCAQVAPTDCADRVLLGLLPHSRCGWAAAVAALKHESGGWLHVHNNVLDREEAAWIQNMVAELTQLCHALPGRAAWVVTPRHTERVKWYAPRIRHIVVDVELRPANYQPREPVPVSVGSQPRSTSTSAAQTQPARDTAVSNAAPRPAAAITTAATTAAMAGSQRSTTPAAATCTAPSGAQRPSAGVPWFQRPVSELRTIPRVAGVTRDMFETQVSAKRFPTVLAGLDLGPALDKWTAEYLMNVPGSTTQQVSVHVVREPSGAMDFVHKNFTYQHMTFADLVARASGVAAAGSPGNERFYLRSLGTNPRKDVSDLSHTFPTLHSDLTLPPLFPPESLFSSVLRISSPGLRLWTHYDVMDNLLVQIKGVKRVLLWPPLAAPDLYITGSSSPIINIEHPDLNQHPRFVNAEPYAVDLHPGEVLFIPALWHHHVDTLTPGGTGARDGTTATSSDSSIENGWSISVNVFWRHLGPEHYDKKDVYGNKDLVPANLADKAVQEAVQHLSLLPEPYKSFYTQRCAEAVVSMAAGSLAVIAAPCFG